MYTTRARDIAGKDPRTQTRPSVDGRISPGAILAFTVFNALVFITVAYFVNMLAFSLALPILAILGSYSSFKRFSALAHIILGLSLALVPLSRVVAFVATVPFGALFPSAVLLSRVTGFDLLYLLHAIR